MELFFPNIINIPDERECKYCNNKCIDKNEPSWKMTCGDCYISSILPTKITVSLPNYFLNDMSIDKLSALPMTWGQKYNGTQLKNIPATYWNFVLTNKYFQPEKHMHIYIYLKKIYTHTVI